MQEEILRGGLSQQKRRRTSRLSAIKSAASELYLSNVCAWIGGLVIWSNMNYLLVLPNLSPTSLHRQAYFHPLQLLCAWKSMLRSFEASCKFHEPLLRQPQIILPPSLHIMLLYCSSGGCRWWLTLTINIYRFMLVLFSPISLYSSASGLRDRMVSYSLDNSTWVTSTSVLFLAVMISQVKWKSSLKAQNRLALVVCRSQCH